MGGQDGNIAYCVDGGWRFAAPFAGLSAFIADEAVMLVYTASGWVDWASILNLQNLPLLGVNTTADATNKFALKSNAALFAALEVASGGSDDMHLTLSKSATAKDAALVLQDGFSTRALFGLLGDDNLVLKVSPDGSTFHTGVTIDQGSGAVDHAQGAKFSVFLNYDQYVAAGAFDAGTNAVTAPVAGIYRIDAQVLFKKNAALPTRMMLSLFVNGSEAAQSRAVADALSDQGTTLATSACLKLAAGDVVDARVQFVTNDGYVAADFNALHGVRVA